MDRFYVQDIANYISNIKVLNVDFSDHSGIFMEISLPNVPKVGKYYWKLIVSLLDNDEIKDKLNKEWNRIKSFIEFYDSINTWWELYAKYQIKKIFIEIGREENQKNMVYYNSLN